MFTSKIENSHSEKYVIFGIHFVDVYNEFLASPGSIEKSFLAAMMAAAIEF